MSVNEEKPRKLPQLECHPLSSMRAKIELLTDGAVLLQEAVQHGLLGVRDGRQRALLRCDRGRGAHPLPLDAASVAPEGHRHGLEVPEDGAQGAEVVDAEDAVEAAQVEADARDGERLTRAR